MNMSFGNMYVCMCVCEVYLILTSSLPPTTSFEVRDFKKKHSQGERTHWNVSRFF